MHNWLVVNMPCSHVSRILTRSANWFRPSVYERRFLLCCIMRSKLLFQISLLSLSSVSSSYFFACRVFHECHSISRVAPSASVIISTIRMQCMSIWSQRYGRKALKRALIAFNGCACASAVHMSSRPQTQVAHGAEVRCWNHLTAKWAGSKLFWICLAIRHVAIGRVAVDFVYRLGGRC